MVLVRVPRAEMDGLTVGQAWRDEVTEDESEMFGLTDLRHRRLGCVCHRHGGQTKHAASVLVGLDRLQHLLGQDALALLGILRCSGCSCGVSRPCQPQSPHPSPYLVYSRPVDDKDCPD